MLTKARDIFVLPYDVKLCGVLHDPIFYAYTDTVLVSFC